MKRKTRLAALMLALCLLTAALPMTLPAAAAGTAAVTFSDITDPETAVSVEVLRLLGVLDGYRDGSFRPGTALTRAQFCKMAVYALNAASETGKYRATTIFPDVKPSYWAASYVNLAAKGKKIIAGFADGYFRPGRTVTYGQAVTILMRMLGYADTDVGAVWPDGYLAQADTIGLTDGVKLSASAPLSRGSAARLFANLLRTDTKDKGNYAKTIATDAVEGAMLVSSTAAAADGTDTALQIGTGATYQLANRDVSNGLLNGRMGTLLVDKQGKALTFVPDAVGSSRTVVVSVAAADKLTDTSGVTYAISGSTKTFYDGKQQTWSDAYSWLTPGTTLTLYLGDSGGVEYVFAGGGALASQAVIVYATGSAAGFDSIAGTASYKLYKNGTAATAADLRPYDVATYSAATGSIRVCDVRLTGVYESCTPNPDAPEKITLMGHTFNVLPSARSMLKEFKLGNVITLLLTEDNQVAGAVKTGAAPGNAVGIVTSASGTSATVQLLCGFQVTGTVADASGLEGKVVRASSDKAGTLSLTKLTGGATGALDVTNRKLDGRSLSDNVAIYRRGSTGLTAVSLTQITTATVPASEITYVGTDWAGRVNLIVLGGSISETYYYGRVSQFKSAVAGSPEIERAEATMTVEYGTDKSTGSLNTTFSASVGTFVRFSLNADKSRFTSVLALTALRSVPNAAWNGQSAVTVSGRTYTVPSDVLCYNTSSGAWVTLSQAHGFASASTLYVEDGVVRVIEVSQ